MIRDNIDGISGKIADICGKIGRDPAEIILVGVTKYADAPKINEALVAGLTHIGENKVQEAQKKFPSLKAPDGLTRHMIGHLQSNKAKAAVEYFDLIQSVDSIKLANAIAKEAGKAGRTIDVLIQVNTSGEEQKFGCAPADVDSLAGHLSGLKEIRLKGLMAIAPLTADEQVVRQCFRDLKVIYDRLSGTHDMVYLSMGMTDDYPIALEEGSNMVRIGRAVFQS